MDHNREIQYRDVDTIINISMRYRVLSKETAFFGATKLKEIKTSVAKIGTSEQTKEEEKE